MTPDTTVSTEDIELRLFLEAMYSRYHYDFRGYSKASLKRRLLLACERMGFPSLSALQGQLLHDDTMLPQLLSYLTVQVSDMFRDPGYFRAIREQVIPHLKTYPSLKVWVAGCSSGEELYSLAILFREEGLEEKTMFYATDINGAALAKAEAGVYDLQRIALFTRNHRLSGGTGSLSEYYNAAYGAACFDKTLRRRTVFSDHSLASDSVFAELHLISCRNVLIYFDRPLQDRAVGLFKDALVRNGFLGIGARESLRFNAHAKAFREFLPVERIYQKRSDL
ncbi:MAG: protein-glutamate O-methyltransferase CheR [Nitrospira sp.]|nr:protein-glutamate O-methyltransferase CheR [Nitrospira sp.]HMU31416.1 CheR family methyltransferase [Nitrospira sp.]HMZ96431.1 CheR family methyltransferase [Nitrospira sp.]HNG01803.1 CheR family methyltransferase [Nitrospira sp.]HNM20326.1 CheR family methyltransferase [Nitrospira sp.]